MFTRWDAEDMKKVADRLEGERGTRKPAEQLERAAGGNQLKVIGAADSGPVATSAFKVYLLRVATLQTRGTDRHELGWKQVSRGTVDGRRADDSTPLFAEMAAPGSAFEGSWKENTFFLNAATSAALHWKHPLDRATIFEHANRYASRLLEMQKQYAEWTGLAGLKQSLEQIEARLAQARSSGSCLLSLGWGGGLLGKSAFLETQDESYRRILRGVPLYSQAIRTGMPFPKTRRIVFLGNQPATLPGWATLEVG